MTTAWWERTKDKRLKRAFTFRPMEAGTRWERGETDGRHRDSEPLAADKRVTSQSLHKTSKRQPKELSVMVRVPKLRDAILYQASADDFVPEHR